MATVDDQQNNHPGNHCDQQHHGQNGNIGTGIANFA